MGVFTFTEAINNQDLFKYIVIIIILLYLFMNITIGLNIILALVLGFIIILYLTEKEYIVQQSEQIHNQTKYDTVKPKLEGVSPDSAIIDFLFSVQDFYVYNPQAYEEMIANLESFFILVADIFNDKHLYTYYYQIADSKKNNALNAFQSIIFKLPNDKEFTDKLNRGHERLETILNKYMNDLYDKCDANVKKMGHTTITTVLAKGPVGHNVYDEDKGFTYQFY